MQILPTSRTDNAFSILSGTDISAEGGFFDAMQDAMDAVASGDSHSASSAMASDSQLVESPYSRNTTDGVTYTLEEVCFTKDELAELRQQLVKEGAPEETLKQFDVLASQPDGATLAQVMASLIGVKGGKFSEDDAHAITALLGQIDPTGTLAQDALAFMRDGNGEGALALIQDALGKLAADQRIDITPASLQALGRGLGLDQGTLNSMAAMLGGRSLSLNGAQFNQLLDPARSQFITDAANMDKLEAALDKTLKGVISKARDRMAKEKEATERESRRVQQSRILIDRSVQQNSREMLDETVAGQAAAEAGKAGGMVGHAGQNRAEAAQTQAKKGKNVQDGKTGQLRDGNEVGLAENAKNALNAGKTVKAEDFADARNGGQNDQNGKNGKKDAWGELLGKVDTAVVKGAGLAANSGSVVYSMLQGNLQNEIINMDAQINRNLPQMEQQMARQVERGLLTAMGNGAQRLDLQLHPAELGSLAITLIARNGEVTAQIRSEKSETADMLNRQMDAIRLSLENQGLKVDKIEVQLENRQDTRQDSFADLGQHNARQEEDARRQQLQRMRNLANVLNSGDAEADASLARSLHNMGQSARYAGQALHVVA